MVTTKTILEANISESWRGVCFTMPIDSTGQNISAHLYNPSTKTVTDVLAESILGVAKGEEITVYISLAGKGLESGVHILKINNERLTLLSKILILLGQDAKTIIEYEEQEAILQLMLDEDGNVLIDDDGNALIF